MVIRRCLLLHLFSFAIVAAFCVNVVRAQSSNATTDSSEARVVNSIFNKWSISADQSQWNISGELCSGNAIDSTTTIDDKTFNPFIKCDCSFSNKTICHITALKVYASDVVGEIPPELWTLTYLTNLNLGQNFLSGSLPPAIGNLTRMQYMSLGINALSGELPKELGDLTQLIVLGFGSNNFSGPLPSELGKLVKLDQLYLDSSGISGPIPSTFASLKNLVTVWASDTELTGSIPNFIGNWTKLQTLRFQGNSFEGPIPSSFSNLTSLTELRISGISNGSSSLEVVQNMKSLTILELRNNNFSGSVPPSIGEFQNLTLLDLSFNNISGQIPRSIFNLSSLSTLFLGNNNFSGSLPLQKSSSLRNIDLSYNDLSGSFPSWVNEQNLQLNLVANNLTIENSNSNGLPTGLNCLQKTFPCNRGAGRYSDFAIKCGGPQITSTNGIVYQMDNDSLGPATYFVTDTNRWAVSNVGLFTGSNNPQFKSFVSNQFTNTLNSELFQTARLSASSLRYYGLGLENGFYNITLQFAETAILDSASWKSLGRRVFDIYIQGTRVLKDFDIQREAGGVSYRAVQKQFRFEVKENYLEIHLFWAGKGTCCIPAQGTYGPLIQAISATPDFIPTVSNKPPSSDKNSAGLIIGIVIGVGVVCFLTVVFAIYYTIQRRKRLRDDEELLGIDTKPYTFSYSELKNATNDFNFHNKLGEGGFGPVYKGTLNDGSVIAVKQLSVGSHQGKSQFITEIATISAVQHRNLVKLYGCCIEGSKRLLVYEYLENKSLDQALFGNVLSLNWSTRYDICLGVARGLAYLHEESRLRIVHRDVKASNILLDSELVPKISDFGLAKLYDDKKTHISTRVAGTIGYLAPEYAMRGHLTEKADVFSFGVVALELVSGRPNSDTSLEGAKMYLLEWRPVVGDRDISREEEDLQEHSTMKVKGGKHTFATTSTGLVSYADIGDPPMEDVQGRRSYKETVMGLHAGDKEEDDTGDEEGGHMGEAQDDGEYTIGCMDLQIVEKTHGGYECPEIVIPPRAEVRLCRPWKQGLIFKLLGRRIGFKALENRLNQMWVRKGVMNIIDLGGEFFLVCLSSPDDHDKAFTNGPWLIYDHYLTVREWKPNFRPDEEEINRVNVWVRLPELPIEYYDPYFLVFLGNRIGKTVKVDKTTEQLARGKYARLCVEIDLDKPLLAMFEIKNHFHKIEYEGLHMLCMVCGRFGHHKDQCPDKVTEDGGANNGEEERATDNVEPRGEVVKEDGP